MPLIPLMSNEITHAPLPPDYTVLIPIPDITVELPTADITVKIPESMHVEVTI